MHYDVQQSVSSDVQLTVKVTQQNDQVTHA